MISRRSFLKTVASAGAWSLTAPLWPSCTKAPFIEGEIWGAPASIGHLLREGRLPAPTETIEADILIVGGGISGLSAARRLIRLGQRSITLLELDGHIGGNALGGQHEASPFPWGAHYMPMPDQQQPELLAFLEEAGVITGYDHRQQPIIDEQYLCHAPEERIYHHGAWVEGLVPEKHLDKADREEFLRFLQQMKGFQNLKGKDGHKVFALPLDYSSQDPEWLALDQISMEQWLRRQGYSSSFLYSYVDYCCRDDYGAQMRDISAWAGIHYLAGRSGEDLQHADDRAVITWPEGNYWLVKQLQKQISGTCQIKTNCLAYRVQALEGGVEALAYNTKSQRSIRFKAKQAILATPTFISRRLLQEGSPEWLKQFSYSPWLVANILCKPFDTGIGAPLSWDNIMYESPSLGYVHANHQQLKPAHDKHVLTYYYALCFQEPAEARKQALQYSHAQWADFVMQEMGKIHTDFRKHVERIDVWIWGHGMIRPTPGFLWGSARKEASLPIANRIFFAHSDLSGISVFEEAFYQGNKAAMALMAAKNAPATGI